MHIVKSILQTMVYSFCQTSWKTANWNCVKSQCKSSLRFFNHILFALVSLDFYELKCTDKLSAKEQQSIMKISLNPYPTAYLQLVQMYLKTFITCPHVHWDSCTMQEPRDRIFCKTNQDTSSEHLPELPAETWQREYCTDCKLDYIEWQLKCGMWDHLQWNQVRLLPNLIRLGNSLPQNQHLSWNVIEQNC